MLKHLGLSAAAHLSAHVGGSDGHGCDFNAGVIPQVLLLGGDFFPLPFINRSGVLICHEDTQCFRDGRGAC